MEVEGIYKDKKEKQKIENVMGIYVTGTMLRNYADCVGKIYDTPDKHGRYMYNKMTDLVKSTDKALMPIKKFLRENGGEGPVDDMVVLYHETIDQIFELDEFQINRIKQLIKKIKDGR